MGIAMNRIVIPIKMLHTYYTLFFFLFCASFQKLTDLYNLFISVKTLCHFRLPLVVIR